MTSSAVKAAAENILDHLCAISEYPLSCFTFISSTLKGTQRTIILRHPTVSVKIISIGRQVEVEVQSKHKEHRFSAKWTEASQWCMMHNMGCFFAGDEATLEWSPVHSQDINVYKNPPSEHMRKAILNATRNVGLRYVQRFSRVDMM